MTRARVALALGLVWLLGAAASDDVTSFIQTSGVEETENEGKRPGKITRLVKVLKHGVGLGHTQQEAEEAWRLREGLVEDAKELGQGLSQLASDTSNQARFAADNIKDTLHGIVNGVMGKEEPAGASQLPQVQMLNAMQGGRLESGLSARDLAMNLNQQRRKANRNNYWKFIAKRTKRWGDNIASGFKNVSFVDVADGALKQAKMAGQNIRDGMDEISGSVKGITSGLTGSWTEPEEKEEPKEKPGTPEFYHALWKKGRKANRNKYWKYISDRTARWAKETVDAVQNE